MAGVIIGRYSDDAEFTTLMNTIRIADREVQRLNTEGFNTLEDIVSTYNDSHELEKLIMNLNKTFGSHATSPYYFPL
jgi:phage host-nuclease inhibitor protein Gam